jgi:hypothetical protein
MRRGSEGGGREGVMIMGNGVRDTHAWLDGDAEDSWKDADTRSCLYLYTGITNI